MGSFFGPFAPPGRYKKKRNTAIFLSCVSLSAGEALFSGVASIDAVEAWLSARATVAGSVLSCGTANFDQVASVGSSLVRLGRQCCFVYRGGWSFSFSRRVFISMLFVVGLGPSRISGYSATLTRVVAGGARGRRARGRFACGDCLR